MDTYTEAAYARMATLKTAYYSFYEPVAVGILLTRRADDSALLEGARAVALRMGEYYQRKDDFRDAFDERAKKGMDIADGKCTWLIIEAMARGDAAQRDTLRERYGRGADDAESEAEVKRVYRELELDASFRAWEAAAVAGLRAAIAVQPVEMHAVWHNVLAVVLGQ